MGGVAGARSHSGPCREAAVEIQSTVPWIGFPVAYALSGILLTVFGYFAAASNPSKAPRLTSFQSHVSTIWTIRRNHCR